MIEYRWKIEGLDVDGNAWHVDGSIKVGSAGRFQEALDFAQREAFQKLTQGKATYGHPGLTCRGPYRYTKLTFEESSDERPKIPNA